MDERGDDTTRDLIWSDACFLNKAFAPRKACLICFFTFCLFFSSSVYVLIQAGVSSPEGCFVNGQQYVPFDDISASRLTFARSYGAVAGEKRCTKLGVFNFHWLVQLGKESVLAKDPAVTEELEPVLIKDPASTKEREPVLNKGPADTEELEHEQQVHEHGKLPSCAIVSNGDPSTGWFAIDYALRECHCLTTFGFANYSPGHYWEKGIVDYIEHLMSDEHVYYHKSLRSKACHQL
ncbi:hypothetical protein CYMTET_4265 [Cymbomonas tetramitiformis]|uniref:Uncharacterized protein n=1 Tax=Cymbomonas tetramitiformis TaxID=36881 RepID=A0AAE0H1S6_9CHLO|nr:hypothetical protein CYMTET_4265 [Cymbomonas tetramitiformis]